MIDGAPWPSVTVDGILNRARREWLHTNGAGAYASSTIAGMHTRRHHGLLVAALDPPGARHVFLSHVDAAVSLRRGPESRNGAPRPLTRPRWELAMHQFPGVDPELGAFYLARFDQDPLPRWTYAVAGGRLEVTLAMVRGENAVVLRYAFHGSEPVLLTLRPLLAARSADALQREHGGMLQRVELRSFNDGAPGPGGATPREMRVQPRRELPRICFRYEGTFVGSPDWWRRFEYLAERDRGRDYEEDLWTPGVFETPLNGAPAYLVVAVDKLPADDPAALLTAARAALLAEDPGPAAPPLARRLAVAAEAYRADLARRPAALAGYPWFDAGSRDTLVALPGLYLVPGRVDAAQRVLRQVISTMQDGLVPDGGSAAATLWLFEAARHVAEALGDRHPFVTDELLLALRDAFDASLRAHVTEQGLIASSRGGPTKQPGCPVELCALWARGCDTLARLARAAGDGPLGGRAVAQRDRARQAFGERFWCEETGYPYDVIDEGGGRHDASVRPGALIALAVDPGCFTPDRAAKVVARARRDLITPAGVRGLAPGDPRYVGRVTPSRDGAPPSGAAWPWLTGAFVRAALRQGESPDELGALVASVAENVIALGHVAELADGDPPHRPAGGFAHAWSVAELLRALVWDLAGKAS